MALALTALILRGVMATSAQYCSLKSNIFRDNSEPEEQKRSRLDAAGLICWKKCEIQTYSIIKPRNF